MVHLTASASPSAAAGSQGVPAVPEIQDMWAALQRAPVPDGGTVLELDGGVEFVLRIAGSDKIFIREVYPEIKDRLLASAPQSVTTITGTPGIGERRTCSYSYSSWHRR